MTQKSSRLRWLFEEFRPFLPSQLLSVLLSVLSSVMFLLDPLLIKWLIDDVLPKRDTRLLLFATGGFFTLYVCRLGFASIARFVSFKTIQKFALALRQSVIQHLTCLSSDYHDSVSTGEKLYRVQQEVDQVAELGASVGPYVLQTLSNVVFVAAAMFALNWRLTCLLLPLVPIMFPFQKYFQKRLLAASVEAEKHASAEVEFVEEHLSSITETQMLGNEDRQLAEYISKAQQRFCSMVKRNSAETVFVASYMGVVAVGTVVVLGYGGREVMLGTLSIGGLVAFYSYLARLFDPLMAAVDLYAQFNRVQVSIGRILSVISQTPSISNSNGAIRLTAGARGSIVLSDVSFSYPNHQLVVNNLNIGISAGEKLAVVGANGSGKSTLAKLIARVYDVDEGAVLIDGINIRNLHLPHLRKQICYLQQHTVVFNRSLQDNLLMANPSADSSQIERAIEIAELDTVFARASSNIGPRGIRLSGGERQRIALARAILRQPLILVLDEATSALDLQTEQRVMSRLFSHFANCTIVFVSHRLSPLYWADRIIVLNNGVIDEQGTHHDLISNSGYYARLCSAQGSFQ